MCSFIFLHYPFTVNLYMSFSLNNLEQHNKMIEFFSLLGITWGLMYAKQWIIKTSICHQAWWYMPEILVTWKA